MDQEREDDRDRPEPPPRSWTGESPLWLFLPVAVLAAVLTISMMVSVWKGPQFD